MAWSDVPQFALAMLGSVILAVVVLIDLGGPAAMLAKVDAAAWAPKNASSLAPSTGDAAAMATAIAFFTLNWWAKAPGHGALAQRLLATRSPRDGALALAWFTVAHYVLRPWPWIIVALASLAVIPESFDEQLGIWVPAVADKDAFPWMIRSHLGAGARGLLVVSMLGAFMSTVDTHVNLSSAYLLNDVLRPAGRLLRRRPEPAAGAEAGGGPAEVWKGRLLALPVFALVLLIAGGFDDIVALYKYLGVIAAGTAPVLILRWYWWRTTAWTEIAAMSTSLIAGNLLVRFGPLASPESGLDSQFGPRLIAVILISALVWIPATWLSQPASQERLRAFRRAIRPAGPGWRRIALEAGESPPAAIAPLIGWAILGTSAIWSAILGTGWLVLGSPLEGLAMLALAALLGVPTIRAASRVAEGPT